MNIIEINDNIFNYSHQYYAHCISSDYALGAGIAVQFDKLYNLRNRLYRVGNHSYPDCILVDNIFNLVTKNKYWDKPTYDTLKMSLIKLHDFVIWMSIKDLAIPRI